MCITLNNAPVDPGLLTVTSSCSDALGVLNTNRSATGTQKSSSTGLFSSPVGAGWTQAGGTESADG